MSFETLGSTSDHCRACAEAGEPDGLAVLAGQQTGGRGSHGRAWASPAGNLYCSVLMRPKGAAREGGLWSLLAGVAVAEAVAALLPDPVRLSLKWPNDLLLDGCKLAGILVDSSPDGAGGLAWLVIGIGVNLAHAPDVPGRRTACLAPFGPPPAPEAMARAILARLDAWRAIQAAEGFAPVRAAFLARAPRLGTRMAVRIGDTETAGNFAGLGEDGSLLLEAGARVRAFAAGEVRLLAGA
ncbi:MAG: biotin--[acetyl-CoA-carboxylase] ligase [Rhodospirillales bacterium]|nr:biotin--[acetyl-CoA-carboxylase] ligase [Rhodospirillales bacterium]MDE2197995.1 biotin--[acetyl-CoA-carboxylase] ligase [Rhodospirillales bacterium]